MAKEKTITVVTGSRAEWGLLEPLVGALSLDFDVLVSVVGQHNSPQFGDTGKNIDGDHYNTLVDSDSKDAVTKSMALTMISLADDFRYNPDCVLLLGDRFETLAAAISAYNQGIPIAHLHGGEITRGSLDQGYRDSITQLTTYHFCSTLKSRSRLYYKVGPSNYERIFYVGAIGADCRDVEPFEKKQFIPEYDYMFIYHPSKDKIALSELIEITRELKRRGNVLAVGSNCDPTGRAIQNCLKEEGLVNHVFCPSFPRDVFLRHLKGAKAIVGNSSAGIIEAPSLGVPTINIGSRQDGREKADSVINCKPNVDELRKALDRVEQGGFSFNNPYYKPNTIENICKILQSAL